MHPLALKVIETQSLRALHVKELPVVSEDFFKYLQGGAGDRGVQAMGEWCFVCILSSISSTVISSNFYINQSFLHDLSPA